MLLCNYCGQCAYISDDSFIEYANVSGTETRYINPNTGEIDEYGDSDVSGTGDGETTCPHCSSSDIEFNWDGGEQDALEIRKTFEGEQKKELEEIIRRNVAESDWDLTKNQK